VTPRARTLVRTAALLGAAGLTLLFWAVLIEPGRLVVRETRIVSRAWSDRPPLRIAVLTDLHVGSLRNGRGHLAEVVARTNQERPDVVVLLGDLVIQGVLGGHFVPPEQIAPVLQGLRARDGVVAVLGNHDWWFDGPRVRRSLEGAGVRVLENEAVPFGEGAQGFWIAGVGDLWTRPVDIGRALGAVPAGEPVVLLTHNPDIFPAVPARVTLTLAGHTHGGQVALPLFGPPIVPSRYGQRYAYGVIVEDGRTLLVSSGIGTSIIPVRWRVPPEIAIVTLSGR